MSVVLTIYMLICSIAVPVYGAVKLFKYLKIKQFEKNIAKTVTNISTPTSEEVSDEVSEQIKNIFGNFEIGGKK